MSSVRPAILDVDGTLVDTNYQHALAWQLAFRQHDVAVPAWRIHRHLGMGGDRLITEVCGEEVEREHGDSIRAAHDTLYALSLPHVSVLADARELILDLKRGGHPVVLASSASTREVDHYLDLLDARELVDGWTTADDVEETKPSPDIVQAALTKLGAQDGVMLGDSPWDVRSAAKLDVPTIAVLTGGFSGEELRDAGACDVFASLGELRDRLPSTPLG